MRNYACFTWIGRGLLILCCALGGTALAADRPPQLLDLSYRPAPFHVESGIEVLPKLLDQENPDVTYTCRWFVNGEEVEGYQELLLPGEYFRRGERIAVEVTSEKDGVSGKPVRSGEIEAGNAPPRIVSHPPTNFDSDSYSYQLEAVDADDDLLTYRLVEAPSGMQLDEENGLLTWAVDQWQEGTITVAVVVEDPYGGSAEQQFTMNPTFGQDKGSADE